MKLEKFDLEKAIHGAKVVTRDGREVKELTVFENLKIYSLVGILDNQLQTWTKQGIFNADHAGENRVDLFLAVEPQTKWVNLYKDEKGNFGLGKWCHSLEEAKYSIDPILNFIKTIEITDEP